MNADTNRLRSKIDRRSEGKRERVQEKGRKEPRESDSVLTFLLFH